MAFLDEEIDQICNWNTPWRFHQNDLKFLPNLRIAFIFNAEKNFDYWTYGFSRINVNLMNSFENLKYWSTSWIFFTMKTSFWEVAL